MKYIHLLSCYVAALAKALTALNVESSSSDAHQQPAAEARVRKWKFVIRLIKLQRLGMKQHPKSEPRTRHKAEPGIGDSRIPFGM